MIGTYCLKSEFFFIMDTCSYSWLRRYKIKGFKNNLIKKKKKMPKKVIVLDKLKSQILKEIEAKKEKEPKTKRKTNVINTVLKGRIFERMTPYVIEPDKDGNVPEEATLPPSEVKDLSKTTATIILSYVGSSAYTSYKRAEQRIDMKKLPIGEEMLKYMKQKDNIYLNKE